MAKGSRIRIVSAFVVIILLVVGTFWGDDDNFPFGPFRMYSTKQKLDGEVRAMAVEGLTPDGAWTVVPFETFGLRRADIEGQLNTLAQPPLEVLAGIDDAYERFNPDGPEYLGFRLREHTFDIENGLEAGETVETVATLQAAER